MLRLKFFFLTDEEKITFNGVIWLMLKTHLYNIAEKRLHDFEITYKVG